MFFDLIFLIIDIIYFFVCLIILFILVKFFSRIFCSLITFDILLFRIILIYSEKFEYFWYHVIIVGLVAVWYYVIYNDFKTIILLRALLPSFW